MVILQLIVEHNMFTKKGTFYVMNKVTKLKLFEETCDWLSLNHISKFHEIKGARVQ